MPRRPSVDEDADMIVDEDEELDEELAIDRAARSVREQPSVEEPAEEDTRCPAVEPDFSAGEEGTAVRCQKVAGHADAHVFGAETEDVA